jgi:hypothetical protein
MKTQLAATGFLIGSLLAPIAGYTAGTDSDRSAPKAFVRDSVITTKIKALLAEEKMSSTIHIKVDTDNNGVVQLSGTAKSQAEVDKAGSIAGGVEGVASVTNNIRVVSAREPMRAAGITGASSHGDRAGSEENRVDARIKEMHAKLKITQAQEDQWSKVAQVMRDNAKQMDTLTKTRSEKTTMSAIDDLSSYAEITDAHAEGIRKFTPAFKTLYDGMSDAQKANADAIFRGHHGARKAS